MMQYKGYLGRSTVNEKEGLIFGEVIGLRDVITYQGRTIKEAEQAFRESIDLYLQTCAEEGLDPDKQFSGKLLIRTKPKIHRILAVYSKALGTSINALAEQILIRAVGKMGHTQTRSAGHTRKRSAAKAATEKPKKPGSTHPGQED